jgi:hypothetical protein
MSLRVPADSADSVIERLHSQCGLQRGRPAPHARPLQLSPSRSRHQWRLLANRSRRRFWERPATKLRDGAVEKMMGDHSRNTAPTRITARTLNGSDKEAKVAALTSKSRCRGRVDGRDGDERCPRSVVNPATGTSKGPADFRLEPDEAFVCEVRRLFVSARRPTSLAISLAAFPTSTTSDTVFLLGLVRVLSGVGSRRRAAR